MRVLGIDPGSTATGYGVVENTAGRLVGVAHGAMRARRSAPLPARLAAILRGLQEVIELHRPEIAVVEKVFVAASPRSALVLGQARGVALAAAAGTGLAVVEYGAREIKLAVAGSGAASKQQVQRMVRGLLGLERPPAHDAADALAAAICHLQRGSLAGLVRGRVARRGSSRRSGRYLLRNSP